MATIYPTDAQADAALLAVELEDAITRFVTGLRGPRQNPVTYKQILARIHNYPMFANVTDTQIDDAMCCCVLDDRFRVVALSLSSHRRHNGAYGYIND